MNNYSYTRSYSYINNHVRMQDEQTVAVHKPIVESKVFIKASSRIVPIHVHTSFKTACQLTLRQKISCTPIPRAAFSLMFKGKFLEPRVPLEHYAWNSRW